MATAKRKQEELGEECDDQEPHDNDQCSDDDDAKRPRLDLHHQHLPHHQLPHHRQWSHAPGADVPRATDSDKDIKLDTGDSATRPAEANPDEFANYKDCRNEKISYRRNYSINTCDRNHESVNSYSLKGVYPEYNAYLAPRTVKETEEAPCDLSNWQVRSVSKFEQNMADNEREIADTNGLEDSVNEAQANSDLSVENSQQPINFAYYHF